MTRVILPVLCLMLASLVFSESAEIAKKDEIVYARSGAEGIVIASENRWYLEEFDSFGRSVDGTLWEKGEIIERTSWFYSPDAQRPDKKIVTGNALSIETEYDKEGNAISIVETDLKGEVVSTLGNVFNEKNLLLRSVTKKGGITKRTVLEYTDTDTIREKRVYTNDELTILYEYATQDNWTETVYSKSVPVLVATFENGVRIKGADEK